MRGAVSVDDHLVEPPDLWQRRLPRAQRARGPRLSYASGDPVWLVEDEPYSLPVKTELFKGLGDEHFGYQEHSLRHEDMLPEFYDSGVRAKSLTALGVVGSICFPAIPKYAGSAFLRTRDTDLAANCISVWNDFLFEEWCPGAPEFFIPVVLVQLWDPVLAAAEVRRGAALGARGASICENGVPLGLPSFHDPHWEPLWQSLQETGLAVCMHVGSSGRVTRPSKDTGGAATITLVEANAMSTVVDLIFGPVPQKYPTLQFVLCESGAAWVPALLERADKEWEIHRPFESGLPPVPPSEIFRRSFSVTFSGDPVAVQLRDHIGVDRLMWGCDYPHTESPYPEIQQTLARAFSGVPDLEAELIASGNARRVFRW